MWYCGQHPQGIKYCHTLVQVQVEVETRVGFIITKKTAAAIAAAATTRVLLKCLSHFSLNLNQNLNSSSLGLSNVIEESTTAAATRVLLKFLGNFFLNLNALGYLRAATTL